MDMKDLERTYTRQLINVALNSAWLGVEEVRDHSVESISRVPMLYHSGLLYCFEGNTHIRDIVRHSRGILTPQRRSSGVEEDLTAKRLIWHLRWDPGKRHLCK